MSTNDPWQNWLESTASRPLQPDPLALAAMNIASGCRLQVLVLGAGTGADLPVFLKSNAVRIVRAIDSSETALRLCRAVVAGIAGAAGRFQFVKKNIANLSPHEIGAPNLISANSVMPYLEPRQQGATMKMLLRQLATDGVFVGNFSALDGHLPSASNVPVYGVSKTDIEKWAVNAGCAAELIAVDQLGQSVTPGQRVYGWHVCIKKPGRQKADGLQLGG